MNKSTRYLYGGAIVCEIPEEYKDLSVFLPIPDHQEVFVYHSNNVKQESTSVDNTTHDFVLSFEILEQISKDNEPLARHLFDDLAYCNEATQKTFMTCDLLDPTDLLCTVVSTAILVTGSMNVARGIGVHKEAPRSTAVFLYILRLPVYKSEILVSHQFPLDTANIDSYKQLTLFKEIVQTLRITDTTLFKQSNA